MYVPAVCQFTKTVSECTCPPLTPPVGGFVEVDENVDEAMKFIAHNLKLSKENTGIRIPPLMISRMSRGGKTTLLLLLFHQLQKEPNTHPIFISFNGSTNYHKGLTQKQAILHSIAAQLTDPGEINRRNIICDEDALDLYLGNEPVVLLIDELNVLASPIDEEAGAMLKNLFLDKLNRYLVFSTHVPFCLDSLISHLRPSSNSSTRECVALPYHPISEFTLLQNLVSNYCELTTREAMIYGGVPSLIYSVKISESFCPFRYYKGFITELTFDKCSFYTLLAAVMDGKLPESLHSYARFGIVTKGSPTEGPLIYWPLCYIIFFLESFSLALPEFRSAIRGILQSYQLLSAASFMEGSGKEWESIINIAILLRCILSTDQSEYSPFDLFQTPISKVQFLNLNREVTTLEAAKRVIDITLSASDHPAVLFAIPTSSTFEVVDGIIAHRTSHNTKYHGYQAKAGKGYPTTASGSLPEWISNCYLLRGRPAENTRDTTRDGRWSYCDKSSINALLGRSLASLSPSMLSTLYPEPSQSTIV